MTLIDLTHVLDEEIPMFPGLPGLDIQEHLSREASRQVYSGGAEFLIQRYGVTGNSGTYLDAPFHRYSDGDDLASLDLERLCNLPGLVFDVSERCSAGVLGADRDLLTCDVSGRAVLIHTGWDRKWRQDDYLVSNPYLTGGLADDLVAGGAVLVGIDSWNVDDILDMSRPAHSILLRAGIPVVENLRGLERLPASGFRFHAAVLPIRSGSAVPVRAYAVVDSE